MSIQCVACITFADCALLPYENSIAPRALFLIPIAVRSCSNPDSFWWLKCCIGDSHLRTAVLNDE